MASSSDRRYGSSGRSPKRSRVVIGAEETTRVRYAQDRPQVASERKGTARVASSASSSGRQKPPAGAARKPSGHRVASQKRDERDRRRRQIAQRRALLGVAAVALGALAVWGLVTLWQAPLFTIDNVHVTGTAHLTPESVIKLAAIPANATLLRLPKSEITSAVSGSPWVAAVDVSRSFPNTLDIRVTERVPVAVVDAQGAGEWLVSGDGHWIVQRTKEATGGLAPIRDVPNLHPVAGAQITSVELNNALSVLAGISPALRAQTKFISAASVEKTMLVLNNAIQVFFGPAEEVAKKDLIARTILAKQKNIVYINVRITDRPTWRGLSSPN